MKVFEKFELKLAIKPRRDAVWNGFVRGFYLFKEGEKNGQGIKNSRG